MSTGKDNKTVSEIGSITSVLLQMISLCAALSLYFSAIYHYGFFLGNKMNILSLFTFSDYTSNAIAFLPPIAIYVIGLNIFLESTASRTLDKFFSYPEIELKNEDNTKIIGVLRKHATKLKAVMIVTVFGYIIIMYVFWRILYYPDLISLLIWEAPIGLILIWGKVFKNSGQRVTDGLQKLLLIFLMISFMTVQLGHGAGKGIFRKEPNAEIFFQDQKKDGHKVYIVRTTQNNIILVEDSELYVHSADDVYKINYFIKDSQKISPLQVYLNKEEKKQLQKP